MQYRRVGDSGMMVSELSFGTGTFGGLGDFYGAWGETDVSEARAIIDLALEGGITLFDTADVYSNGAAEEILGAALRGRRDDVLISTKAGMAVGDGPGEWGSSRSRLLSAVEGSLRRLQTDHIDLFQLHAYDASTPMEEVLQTLELLVQQGKVRCVQLRRWQLMKSLALADEHHRPRHRLQRQRLHAYIRPRGGVNDWRGCRPARSAPLGMRAEPTRRHVTGSSRPRDFPARQSHTPSRSPRRVAPPHRARLSSSPHRPARSASQGATPPSVASLPPVRVGVR
jgi:hypothetical protein